MVLHSKLGLPYMGSKRKLAGKIVDKILQDNPNTKYVYDLFGGGGAISFEFLQRPQIEMVHYNELNAGVVALLKDIRDNGVTEKYFKWISRLEFFTHKNDDDWYGGLCKVVWSFGNNQSDYLFGRSIENNKRLAHLMVVNKDDEARKELEKIFEIEIPKEIFNIEELHARRLYFCGIVRKNKKRFDLQQLQQLEQLEQLQQLQRLEISNLSYEQVPLTTPIDETIVYLDPPYINTGEYQEKLNHTELYEWIAKCPYKIYLSSYESPLKCIAEFEHRTTLSATRNTGKTIERLFVK